MTDRTNEASDKPGARWNLSDQLVNSPDSELPKKPQDQPLNRACEACRISKVRCLMNPDTSSSQCQRCAKANRTCVFAPPAKRRQRKRTDVRVTELEKEIQQMRSLLKTNTTRSSNDVSEHESEDESDDQAHTGEKRKPPSVQSQSAGTTSTYSVFTAPVSTGPMADAAVTGAPTDFFGSSENDIIDRNVVSEDMARELLTIWRNELVTACPGITIPKHWDVLDLRSNKPALFHAIMAAAAHSKGSALSDRLHEETVLLYARSAFIKGEKSVQAIQALIVTVSYYSPSKTPGHLQIYQWVNMAASMALELGLTSKPRTHEQLPKRAIRTLHKISSPEELLEHCRTILLLYIISAGFSMRLKRPNILLFNSWMEECSNILEKSKLLDDKRILAWLKLQRIADEANTAFGFDDASTSFTLSELRMQIILRIFDRRMQDWRKSVPDDVMTLNLELEYHADMLSMWEFGMDGGRYDVIEFRNRYVTLPALDDDCVQPESLLSRSALQINATTKCISAAHAMLDSFIAVPTDKLRKSPNALYVRAVYSLVTLLKADYAVGTDAEMGELFESQNLKVQFYLDTVLKKTKEAAGPQECRNPSHWNFLLEAKLKSWWDEYREWRKEALQMPNFNITNSYPTQPTWNTNELGLDTTTPAQQQPVGDQAAYTHEMGDFSAAFQNGDLYLWNDLTADNFNGWVPQNGPYGGMGFGGMNSQGF
ncbi:C6 zinc finger domain protein [Pyrenophora tritici-repentis]|nr:C6 zinc finger domain protein [Pyrenophora tritici-repentis]